MNVQLLVTVNVEEYRITDKDKERMKKAFPAVGNFGACSEHELLLMKATLMLNRGVMRGCRIIQVRDADDPKKVVQGEGR